MSTPCLNLVSETPLNYRPSFIAQEDLAEIVNQSLTEAVFRCTTDGEIIYINNAFAKLFSITNTSEVIGQKASMFYEDMAALKKVNQQVTSLKRSFKGDVSFKKMDGFVFHGHLSARLVIKERTKYIDGVIRDVSHERKSNFEIDQQNQIQNLLLKISTAYLDADLDAVDKVVNDSLEYVGSFLLADRLQVHDYNFDNGRCVMSFEWTSTFVPNIIMGNHSFPLEYIEDLVAVHEKGEHLFFPSVPDLPDSPVKEGLMHQGIKSTLTVPMKLNGKCVGFISVDSMRSFTNEYSHSAISMLKLFANMIANISTRAKGHSRMRELIEQVTLQSKQHKDFSFITSHNIRASVANLVAITNLMTHEYSERYLDMLEVTVNKLNDSLTNINNILHLDQKELLRKSSCNIKDSVNRVLQSLEMAIRDQDLDIVVDSPDVLAINTLPSYLDNIFRQLIINAIQFGTNDQSKKIIFRAIKLGKHVHISIIDFGSGFDTVKYSNQLFKVGARFHHNNCDGQGLGLYITKQQVESLEGTIKITSSEDRGTVVDLVFPIF